MLKLDRDWKKILMYAWSVRLNFLVAILAGLEVAMPLLQYELPIPTGIFALLAFLVSVMSNIARVIQQKEFDK
jgi:hypothetical protein